MVLEVSTFSIIPLDEEQKGKVERRTVFCEYDLYLQSFFFYYIRPRRIHRLSFFLEDAEEIFTMLYAVTLVSSTFGFDFL